MMLIRLRVIFRENFIEDKLILLLATENARLELSGTGNVWNATCGIT